MNNLQIIGGALTERASNQNPAAIYLAALAPTGRRAIAGRLHYVANLLNQAFETFPWSELRYQHLEAIRSKLQETGQAPATINQTLYALRGVSRAAFNLGLMSADDYQRLRDVKPVNGHRVPAGRALGIGEISALLNACDNSPIGTRDAAIIALMYSGGLRRAEVIALDLDHYNTDTGELKVTGKGNRERVLHVVNGAAAALKDWLTIRGSAEGALFHPVTKASKIQSRRMTDQAIYNLLGKLATAAEVRQFSPHDLRRSFISELLDRGADIATVQKLAGHASVTTTAKYDRRDEKAKRKAQELLHVPYRGSALVN